MSAFLISYALRISLGMIDGVKDMMMWSRTKDGVDGPILKMEKYHQDVKANLIDLCWNSRQAPVHNLLF